MKIVPMKALWMREGERWQMNVADVRNLYAYNLWATDHQLTVIRQLSEEQFNRELGGSFPSIRLTLLHIVGAEELWITRLLEGQSPTRMLADEDYPTLENIERQLGATRVKWKNYLDGLVDDQLAEPFFYRNLRGEQISLPLWQILHHIANHATYHRGQITSMLRQVGVTPPGVDAVVFYHSLT
jgi:uncharacterized damage-inducible protein DinB